MAYFIYANEEEIDITCSFEIPPEMQDEVAAIVDKYDKRSKVTLPSKDYRPTSCYEEQGHGCWTCPHHKLINPSYVAELDQYGCEYDHCIKDD